MAPRFFRLTIHREWVVKVTNDKFNEDAIWARSVPAFLDFEPGRVVEMEPIADDDDEHPIGDREGDQFWDHGVTA